MNGTQVGDVYRRLSPCKEWVVEFVKVILVSDKEYAVVACDENGVEERFYATKIRYVQRHIFIERYEKVEKVK